MTSRWTMNLNEFEKSQRKALTERDDGRPPLDGVEGSPSGGPRTPEGKRISRKNAVKHGMAARELVAELVGEDRFEEALAEFRAELRPEGHIEDQLVRQLAQASLSAELNMKQYRAVARHLARSIDAMGPDVGLKAVGDTDATFVDIVQSMPFRLASRYSAAAASMFQRTLKAFHARRMQRKDEDRGRGDAAEEALDPLDEEGYAALLEMLDGEGGWRRLVSQLRREWLEAHGLGWAAENEKMDEMIGDTFLSTTGVSPEKALRLAVELLARPGASIAALRERSGINRRQTVQKLVRHVDGGEAQRDWLLGAMEGRLRPP